MITKRFTFGLAIGLLTFFFINIIAAHLSSDCGLLAVLGRDACADDIVRIGWPLKFYEAGGFAYRLSFSPYMLGLDTGIALLAAIASGWIFSTRQKITH